MKEAFSGLLCGLNEVSFTTKEVKEIKILTEIFRFSFDKRNANHVKIVKALYFKVFVQNQENKG